MRGPSEITRPWSWEDRAHPRLSHRGEGGRGGQLEPLRVRKRRQQGGGSRLWESWAHRSTANWGSDNRNASAHRPEARSPRSGASRACSLQWLQGRVLPAPAGPLQWPPSWSLLVGSCGSRVSIPVRLTPRGCSHRPGPTQHSLPALH